MTNYDDPEIIARRLLKTTKAQATASAAVVLDQAGAQAKIDVDEHASRRSGVHGVPPGMFVARTSNPSGYVRYNELVGIPPAGGIDPTLLELAADQIVSGTIPDERLPIEPPGGSGPGLVRGNDPRLTSRGDTVETGAALALGTIVTIQADGRAVPASSASSETAAVGFVAESYGLGEQALIWPFGVADRYLVTATSSSLMQPVFLGLNGAISLTMPTSGIIQQVGYVIGVGALPVVRVFVSIFDYMEII
jgi:hypothetical protein